MSKPKIISKTKLRSTLAASTRLVENEPDTELWINGKDEVTTVLVNADRYSGLKDTLKALRERLFELETNEAIKKAKGGELSKFDSIDGLMKDLNDDL